MRGILISATLLMGLGMCVAGAYSVHHGLAAIVVGGLMIAVAIVRGLRQ